MIDTFNKVLNYNGINLNLYFETLKPLEFTNADGSVDEEIEEKKINIAQIKRV